MIGTESGWREDRLTSPKMSSKETLRSTRSRAGCDWVDASPSWDSSECCSRWSAFLYSHFDLIEDFGIEAQAWHQIGHGNLDPNTTIYGYPFIQNNMQLYMWPLAIVGRFLNNVVCFSCSKTCALP